MARMHSRAGGKSKSKRPLKVHKPSWLTYKPKEIELLVIKLHKDNKTPSQIGLYLRDAYGIPDVKLLVGKSITRILEDKKLLAKVPEDLTALIRKSILIGKHLDKNKQDMPAKRGLQLTQSKINRLTKYYKEIGRLPREWKFNPKQAALFIE